MTKTTDDDIPRLETSGSEDRYVELEKRVSKLETALVERNTSIPTLLEESVADRVIAKLSTTESPQTLIGSDRVLVLSPTHEATPPPPKGAVLHPPEASVDPSQRTWFFSQLWGELRLAMSMYFDPRYRISRTTQFALPGIALILLFNYFFFNLWFSMALVSPIAERFLDIALSVIAYKLLMRELERYREVLNYMNRYGHR